MKSTPDKDAGKIVAMTTKDLEYVINWVDKAVAGFERLIPILKEVLLWVKSYQIILHALGVPLWLS